MPSRGRWRWWTFLRGSRQQPEPWAGIGVEDAPLNPGPVGWALLRKGRTTWVLAAGYAGYGIRAEETTELTSYYDYYDYYYDGYDATTTASETAEPPVLHEVLEQSQHLGELAVAAGHDVGRGHAVGLSFRARALWLRFSMPGAGSYSADWIAAGSGTIGVDHALDLDGTLAFTWARTGERGGWLVGLTGSGVATGEWSLIRSGEFDADGGTSRCAASSRPAEGSRGPPLCGTAPVAKCGRARG